MSNIFENKGAFAATIVVAASDSRNRGAANYVCDGAADDVEINAALAALPAAGGKVLLLEGNYTTTANIVVPANATLEGQGKATIITPTGATITNSIVLNGDNITLKDMKVILAAGAGAGGSRPNVVYAAARTLLWLENLWLVGDTTVGDDGSDSRQNGIYLIGCTYCKVAKCYSTSNMRRGIYLYSCSYNTITGNTCRGNISSGISLVTDSNYNTITGNTCQGNTYGIFLIASFYNTITGNTCQGSTRHGILLTIGSTNNTLTGNICDSNGGAATYSGIHIESSDQNVITGNQCRYNGLHGISIFRSSYCTVTGNGCHANRSGDGINVEGDVTTNSDYNTITGNACTGNFDDGIAIEGVGDANKNIAVANQLLGNGGTPLVDNGTLTEVGHNITV